MDTILISDDWQAPDNIEFYNINMRKEIFLS